MLEDIDTLKKLMMMNMISKEMFWAYEAVRRSGIWNMLCVNPMLGRYQVGSDPDEMIKVMDDAYLRFVIYTNADIEQDKYKHITKDHVRLIQELYTDLYKEYGKDYPEGIVNITRECKVKISI